MWIKIIICTNDREYEERLAYCLDKNYGDKLEIILLDHISKVTDYLKDYDADFILCGSEFEDEIMELDPKELPPLAFLEDQSYKADVKKSGRIAKYQRMDRIYQNILDIYSAGNKLKQFGNRMRENDCRITAVVSGCGGCGSTTIARAYAKKAAAYNKTLYLDIGILATDYEQEDGNGLDDILVALKSRRDILHYKLESAVQTTKDRYNTFAPCRNSLDLLELSKEDITCLIEGIKKIDTYQHVVFDIGARLFSVEMEILKYADSIVYVIEDNEHALKKYRKFMDILSIYEQKAAVRVRRKTYFFQNKVKKYVMGEDKVPEGIAGWAPEITSLSYNEIIDRIAQSDSFHNLEIKYAD